MTCLEVNSQCRLALALGHDAQGIEAGEDHDGPQESADHGPQHAAAQCGATVACIDLVRPLAENVPVRKGRETENSAKQEEQIDVDVHDKLLMRAIRAV